MFGLFKKKVRESEQQQDVHLGMILFEHLDNYRLEDALKRLQNYWDIQTEQLETDDSGAAFMAEGMSVTIMNMNIAIPLQELEQAASIAYNWPSAEETIKIQRSHVIIAVLPSLKSQIDRYFLISKIVESILSTSVALGVYSGGQSLLISKQQYLNSMANFKEHAVLPIDLWVYVGLAKFEDGCAGYTYGLCYFNKLEMEIIKSELNLEEIYELIINTCAYVIQNNIAFKEGQTVGITNEEKIRLTISEGLLVQGMSIKLVT